MIVMLILIFISFRPFSDFTFEGFFFSFWNVMFMSIACIEIFYGIFNLRCYLILNWVYTWITCSLNLECFYASWPIFKRIKIIERMHSFYYAWFTWIYRIIPGKGCLVARSQILILDERKEKHGIKFIF